MREDRYIPSPDGRLDIKGRAKVSAIEMLYRLSHDDKPLIGLCISGIKRDNIRPGDYIQAVKPVEGLDGRRIPVDGSVNLPPVDQGNRSVLGWEGVAE